MEEANKKVVEEVEIKKDSVDKVKTDVIVVDVNNKKPNIFVAVVDKAKNFVGKMPKGLKILVKVTTFVGGCVVARGAIKHLFGKKSILDGNFEEVVDSEEDFVSSDDVEE